MTYILGFIIIGFVFAILFGRFCKVGRGESSSASAQEEN